MKPAFRQVLAKIMAAAGGGLVVFALGVAGASLSLGHHHALQLSWDGEHYWSSTSDAFFGTPTVAPGDAAQRTLLVRNNGPSDAILRATITNVELTGDHTEGFTQDLMVAWDTGQASMAQLADNGDTLMLELHLPQGAETEITLGYHLPVTTVDGNRAGAPAPMASFEVQLDLVGMAAPDGQEKSSQPGQHQV